MLKCFYVKPVCKHQMDCLSVKCLSFVVRQLVFAICSQSVLVGASVRNMQGCMTSTGQRQVCITKNLQRPFWPQFVPEERTPEHVHDFLHVAWKQPKPNRCFVLTCMLHDFPEEICVSGGTDFFWSFLFCTSPDDASLKGGCAENLYFRVFVACLNQRCFCMSYFKYT